MIREDYLVRQIRQLAEVLARILGLARSGKTEEALRDLDAHYTSQLGLPRSTLDRLDARSVLTLVGRNKAELVVQLIDAEAEVLRTAGKPEEAARRTARAEALRRALSA